MSDSFSKAVDTRASKLPHLVWDEGDTYPRLRIPVGSSAIESAPMWALTKEGREKHIKGMPSAWHDAADTAGAAFANFPAAARRYAEGLIKTKDEVRADPVAYAKKKYNKLEELGPALAGDPLFAAQFPANAVAIGVSRNPVVQRVLRLDKTPLDEAAIATVVAEKILGAEKDDSKQDLRWFPKTRDAFASLPADYRSSVDEIIKMGEEDPRYEKTRDFADQIRRLVESIPGIDESDMEDPFEIPKEKPKSDLVSQKK